MRIALTSGLPREHGAIYVGVAKTVEQRTLSELRSQPSVRRTCIAGEHKLKATPMKNTRAPRRSQAERKESLHRAVLNAAISLLHERGYAAASTMLVAETAGVSRGAMLNHFPTKADLMTFVVSAVYQDELEHYKLLLKDIDDPLERARAYPRAAWKVLSRPSGVAVLEIFMGSRSDYDLAEKLRPVQEKIQSDSIEILEREMGHSPDKNLVRLITWAIRGLSIENMLSEGDGAAESMQLFEMLIDVAHYIGRLQRGDHAI